MASQNTEMLNSDQSMDVNLPATEPATTNSFPDTAQNASLASGACVLQGKAPAPTTSLVSGPIACPTSLASAPFSVSSAIASRAAKASDVKSSIASRNAPSISSAPPLAPSESATNSGLVLSVVLTSDPKLPVSERQEDCAAELEIRRRAQQELKARRKADQKKQEDLEKAEALERKREALERARTLEKKKRMSLQEKKEMRKNQRNHAQKESLAAARLEAELLGALPSASRSPSLPERPSTTNLVASTRSMRSLNQNLVEPPPPSVPSTSQALEGQVEHPQAVSPPHEILSSEDQHLAPEPDRKGKGKERMRSCTPTPSQAEEAYDEEAQMTKALEASRHAYRALATDESPEASGSGSYSPTSPVAGPSSSGGALVRDVGLTLTTYAVLHVS